MLLPPISRRSTPGKFRRRRNHVVVDRPTLFEETRSTRFKSKQKREITQITPFLAGGNPPRAQTREGAISDRTPGLFDDSYDTAWDAHCQDRMSQSARILHGAFYPVGRNLPPLHDVTKILAAGFAGTGLNHSQSQSTVDSLPRATRVALQSAYCPASGARKLSIESGSRNSEADDHPAAMIDKTMPMALKGRKSLFIRSTQESPFNPDVGAAPNSSPFLAEAEPSDSIAEQQRRALRRQEQQESRDSLARTIFKKLADDGRVQEEDLPHALQMLGYARPDKVWIREVLQANGDDDSLLFEEFKDFLTGYLEKQNAVYWEAFQSADDDDSGSISVEELRGTFKSFGVEPMVHVLNEVIEEVDKDESGLVDYEEFTMVMDILRAREGFTKADYEEIIQLYQNFDNDQSGSVETSELRVALQWLGFAFSERETKAIIKEVDRDGSGQIDSDEWLLCMRLLRDRKMESLRQVIKDNDLEGNGTIQYSELVGLVRALGYVPNADAVREAASEAGIEPDDDDLDFSELWRLLKVFRLREGLTQEELDEIEAAFAKCGCKADGCVPVTSVGKLIRGMGYVLQFDQQQTIVNAVDIDNSGKLDVKEFRKMIRILRGEELETFRLAFNDAAGLKASDGAADPNFTRCFTSDQRKASEDFFISTKDAVECLRRVGCTGLDFLKGAAGHTVVELLPLDQRQKDAIDFYGFCEAAVRGNRLRRLAFRQNGGFNVNEVATLRTSFNMYDKDHSGEINGQEIKLLMEKEFPVISRDPRQRPMVVQLLEEADEDGTGKLDFPDFLRVMRVLKDMQEQVKITKELKAMAESNFTKQEVEDFRQLFISVAGGRMEITFEDVKELLAGIVPMGSKNVEQLRKKYLELAQMQEGVAGAEELLDFPEFLWLMRALLKVNFANLNARTSLFAEGTD